MGTGDHDGTGTRSSERRAVLVAGPTASGKSGLALDIAERVGGVIVNADSMQVYRELRVLTARPSADEEARHAHCLYGYVSAAVAYSVARWLADVETVLAEAWRAGRTPIVVGGTGLAFKALTEGLSPVPAISPGIRRLWRERAAGAPPGHLHGELARRDPVMAARLKPGDTQRLTRALEVIEATGISLADWQRLPGKPVLAADETVRLVVLPPRAVLHGRLERRFDAMIDDGALEEVRGLLALSLPPDAPAMRAIGVGPLAAHLAGTLSLEAAVAAAKADTRRYVKRQETWLKRHMIAWNVITEPYSCNMTAKIMQLIDR